MYILHVTISSIVLIKFFKKYINLTIFFILFFL